MARFRSGEKIIQNSFSNKSKWRIWIRDIWIGGLVGGVSISIYAVTSGSSYFDQALLIFAWVYIMIRLECNDRS